MTTRIRTDIEPGDIGSIIRLHGVLYAAERGWDWTFEAYVAETFARFAEFFDARTDRLWVAERDSTVVGSIGIVGADDDGAQLRWFLVHPDARGSGLGRRLLQKALEFCRAIGRKRVFLWTASDLSASAHLYRAAGFQLTESIPKTMWGAEVIEEHHELRLTP